MSGLFPMTVEGHTALKAELKQLKGEERPSVVKAIEEARSHGDLSENAEYDAAKDRQGFVEARIREVEGKLSNANVIDTSTLGGDKVLFGATVTILMYDKDEEQQWQIVGDDEADLTKKKIGVSSPIARALIGREIGEEIEIKSPGEIREGEILTLAFG